MLHDGLVFRQKIADDLLQCGMSEKQGRCHFNSVVSGQRRGEFRQTDRIKAEISQIVSVRQSVLVYFQKPRRQFFHIPGYAFFQREAFHFTPPS